MKDKTIKVVACYVRVSTQEQAEHGYSIEEQTERLQGYCKAMGWKVAKVYTDAGYTGANMNRPALSDLVEGANRHLFDAVVVFKLDRLSRSQKDTLTLIEGFLAHDVAFVSMTENFDTSTPFGRATIGILSCFAQLEREQIKERCSLGREGRAKGGKYRGGGYTPIGYEYKDGQLIVNESEAAQIRLIHERFQHGDSFRIVQQRGEAFGVLGFELDAHVRSRIESVFPENIVQCKFRCGSLAGGVQRASLQVGDGVYRFAALDNVQHAERVDGKDLHGAV